MARKSAKELRYERDTIIASIVEFAIRYGAQIVYESFYNTKTKDLKKLYDNMTSCEPMVIACAGEHEYRRIFPKCDVEGNKELISDADFVNKIQSGEIPLTTNTLPLILAIKNKQTLELAVELANNKQSKQM
jgi:hypothetical protein